MNTKDIYFKLLVVALGAAAVFPLYGQGQTPPSGSRPTTPGASSGTVPRSGGVESSGRSAPASNSSSSTTRTSSGTKILEITNALVTLINDVPVPAQEAGRLMAIHVRGGEQVDQGFLLAEIDNRDTLAKQKIANAEVEVATAQAESTAELEVAQKATDVSKAEYDASVEIRERNPGAVSLTELRKYRFQWEKAQAQVALAQTDRHIAGLTTGVKQAQLEATDNELERRRIVAPFKGEVNEVYRQVGEWVQPGEPVVHLVSLERLRVNAFVFAKDASPIDVYDKPVEIKVTTAGGVNKTLKGKVTFASPILDGYGEGLQFRISVDVDNERVINPATRRESWAVQAGATATMLIDVTPAPVRSAPRPAPRSDTRGAAAEPPRVEGATSTVDTFKPVLTGPGAESKSEENPTKAAEQPKSQPRER